MPELDPQPNATDPQYRAFCTLRERHPELTEEQAWHLIEHGWMGAYLTLSSALGQLVGLVIEPLVRLADAILTRWMWRK